MQKYKDLSVELKKKLTYAADIKSEGVINVTNVMSRAKTMLAVRQAWIQFCEKSNTLVSYEVFRSKGDKEPTW